jgi:[ribosomal protein S5]-alanine N-acetyltransferase
MHEHARFQTWCVHAIVLGGQMVGHAGYHGPPGRNAVDAPDAVELGYAIVVPYRRRGYATEAARMLMDMAAQRDIRHVVLAVSPTNAPSLAIVDKLGFLRTGERMDNEDGLEQVFELRG